MGQGDDEVEEEVKDDEEEIVEEEDKAEEEEVKEEEEERKRVNKWAQHTVNYDALYDQGDDEVEEEVKKDEEEIVEEEEIAEEEEVKDEEEEPKRVNKWAQHTVDYDALYEQGDDEVEDTQTDKQMPLMQEEEKNKELMDEHVKTVNDADPKNEEGGDVEKKDGEDNI